MAPQRLSRRRKLSIERLSARWLLASDLTNPADPMDVNDDDSVSALDALMIINYISKANQSPAGEPLSDGLGREFYPDASGDGDVTALDALKVINRIGQGEQVDTPSPDSTPLSVATSSSTSAFSLAGITGLQEFDVDDDIEIELLADNLILTITTPTPGFLRFTAMGNFQDVPLQDSLEIEISGQGNTLVFDGAVIPGDLEIELAGGNHTVRLSNTRIGDDFHFEGSGGTDNLTLDNNTLIGDDAEIDTKGGNDVVTINGASVADNVELETGDGNDLVNASNLNVGDDLDVETEDGDDAVTARNVNVGDDLDLDTGNGNDMVDLLNVAVRDEIDLDGDDGTDRLIVAQTVPSVPARKVEIEDFEL